MNIPFRNSLLLFLFYITIRIMLLMNLEHFEKAVGAFKKALKSRSNPADAIAQLGKAHGLLGNKERELEYLEIASRL
jgi:tetratricopeptide (TPR) repeat protein